MSFRVCCLVRNSRNILIGLLLFGVFAGVFAGSSHATKCPTCAAQPDMLLRRSAARTCAMWTCTDGYAQNAAYARNVPRLGSFILMADSRTASCLQRSTRATTCAATRPVCTWIATRDTRTEGPRCMPHREMRAVPLAPIEAEVPNQRTVRACFEHDITLPCAMQRR